jgi:hypothetical protein
MKSFYLLLVCTFSITVFSMDSRRDYRRNDRDDDRRGDYRRDDRDDDRRGNYKRSDRDDDRRGDYRRDNQDDDRRGDYRRSDRDDDRIVYRRNDRYDHRIVYRRDDGDDDRTIYRITIEDDEPKVYPIANLQSPPRENDRKIRGYGNDQNNNHYEAMRDLVDEGFTHAEQNQYDKAASCFYEVLQAQKGHYGMRAEAQFGLILLDYRKKKSSPKQKDNMYDQVLDQIDVAKKSPIRPDRLCEMREFLAKIDYEAGRRDKACEHANEGYSYEGVSTQRQASISKYMEKN